MAVLGCQFDTEGELPEELAPFENLVSRAQFPKLSAKRAENWFERYRLQFNEDLSIDWNRGPVSVTDLEQINLTRDDLIHNVDVATIYVYQTEKHAEQYPKSLFTDQMWMNLGLGGKILIKKTSLPGQSRSSRTSVHGSKASEATIAVI